MKIINEKEMKIEIKGDEEWFYDYFGGFYVTNYQNGSRFYVIEDDIYIDRKHYLQESRDRKIKDLGL